MTGLNAQLLEFLVAAGKQGAFLLCGADFNMAHGCGKQRVCPYGKWHRCSFVSNDQLCASTNHNKADHLALSKFMHANKNTSRGLLVSRPPAASGSSAGP